MFSVGGICLLNKTYPIMLWNFRVFSKHSCDFFVSAAQSCNPIISETFGHLLTPGSQADPENARNPHFWMMKNSQTFNEQVPTRWAPFNEKRSQGLQTTRSPQFRYDTTSSMQYPKWCQDRSPVLILGSFTHPTFLLMLNSYFFGRLPLDPQQPMEK